MRSSGTKTTLRVYAFDTPILGGYSTRAEHTKYKEVDILCDQSTVSGNLLLHALTRSYDV